MKVCKYVKLDDVKAKVEQAEIDAHWHNEVFNAEYINDVLDFIPWVDGTQLDETKNIMEVLK